MFEGKKKRTDETPEEKSALLIQLGRIEEKVDNLSNKVSFEHGHIREDTQYTATALRDFSPTLVELEHLKRDLLQKISDAVSDSPKPGVEARARRGDRVSDGIIELMGDGAERSVSEVTELLRPVFSDYGDNSLRVVVSRKLNRLVSNGAVEARDSKNRKLYCRKI